MPDPDDDRNTLGLPAEPTSAFARLMNQEGTFLEIGGVGDTTAAVSITAKEGTTVDDKGAILDYTVGAEFTEEEGDYTLYITAVYANGTIRTEDRKYKVLEMR